MFKPREYDVWLNIMKMKMIMNMNVRERNLPQEAGTGTGEAEAAEAEAAVVILPAGKVPVRNLPGRSSRPRSSAEESLYL